MARQRIGLPVALIFGVMLLPAVALLTTATGYQWVAWLVVIVLELGVFFSVWRRRRPAESHEPINPV